MIVAVRFNGDSRRFSNVENVVSVGLELGLVGRQMCVMSYYSHTTVLHPDTLPPAPTLPPV